MGIAHDSSLVAGDGAPIGSAGRVNNRRSSELMRPESGGGGGAGRSFQKVNDGVDSTGFLVTDTATGLGSAES